MELQKDLQEFLGLLISKKVDFLVVGAHAVAYHGHPRFTGDINFLILRNRENAIRLEEAFAAFGFSGDPFVVSEFLKPEQTFQLGRPPNRIGVLTSITGVDSDEAWARKVRGRLGRNEVFYISKADLLTNKLATGRPKDLADAQVLSGR